jgi:dTDP-glucose 4,6-dehydratase
MQRAADFDGQIADPELPKAAGVVDGATTLDAAVNMLGDGEECATLELARLIAHVVGVPEAMVRFVNDRPAHDRRYAMRSEKMAVELGWQPRVTLAEGLARTAGWYRGHDPRWRTLKDAGYQAYCQRPYGQG